MGRVWREGQQKHVYIYRIITAGSIEEKIYQRQLSKEGLSRVLIDDNANESRTFSRDELRALFQVGGEGRGGEGLFRALQAHIPHRDRFVTPTTLI